MSVALRNGRKVKIVTGEAARRHHPHAVRVVIKYYDDDGCEWQRWLVIDRKKAMSDVSNSRKECPNCRARALSFIEPTGDGWEAYYGGPGMGFARRPYRLKRRSRRWIVWVQSGGVDV